MRSFIRTNALAAVLVCLGALVALIGCEADNSVTPREGELQGTVYSKSGAVLKDVLVSWTYDPTRWGRSGTDGVFHIAGIGFGEQEFVATKSGYRPKTFRAAIYSNAVSVISNVTMETSSFDYQDITVADFSSTHAVITWKTTDYTNGLVEYGTTDSFGSYINEPSGQYATTHSVTITGLKPNQQYFFRIIASRQGRESETSTSGTFSTLAPLEDSTVPAPPSATSIAVDGTPNQVVVFWAPNTENDLKGYRIYRSELPSSGYALISDTLIAKGQERYTDTSVKTGMKYYYRVSAVDQAGNESGPSEIVSMLVPGEITGTVTWTLANSPFVVPGDITVTDIGTLKIDPGVVVKMADSDVLRTNDTGKVEILVTGGVLIASTSSDQPIIFTSERPTPSAGDWGGISISDSADAATALCGVTIAYAATGLKLEKAAGHFRNLILDHCTVGGRIVSCTDLAVDASRVLYTQDGVKATGNTRLSMTNNTFSHGVTGIDASGNEASTYAGNNFFDLSGVGLSCADTAGSISVTNNLFVAKTGLGLRISGQPPTVDYNTFDAAYGIQVVNGVPTIRKNILVAGTSFTGQGFKGIENLGSQATPPVFGPNNVYGFPAGKEYLGCASASGSLASSPLFVRDFTGDTYDYRLQQAFPSTADQWGIQRTEMPE